MPFGGLRLRLTIIFCVPGRWLKLAQSPQQKKLFYNLNRIKARLGIYENRELEPTVVKSIARELVVDENVVVEMNRRMGGDKSLNVAACDDSDRRKKSILSSTVARILRKTSAAVGKTPLKPEFCANA